MAKGKNATHVGNVVLTGIQMASLIDELASLGKINCEMARGINLDQPMQVSLHMKSIFLISSAALLLDHSNTLVLE